MTALEQAGRKVFQREHSGAVDNKNLARIRFYDSGDYGNKAHETLDFCVHTKRDAVNLRYVDPSPNHPGLELQGKISADEGDATIDAIIQGSSEFKSSYHKMPFLDSREQMEGSILQAYLNLKGSTYCGSQKNGHGEEEGQGGLSDKPGRPYGKRFSGVKQPPDHIEKHIRHSHVRRNADGTTSLITGSYIRPEDCTSMDLMKDRYNVVDGHFRPSEEAVRDTPKKHPHLLSEGQAEALIASKEFIVPYDVRTVYHHFTDRARKIEEQERGSSSIASDSQSSEHGGDLTQSETATSVN